MEYVIGLDIGTTSTKAIAFDTYGKIIAENQIGYPILNPQPFYFEQDCEVIFQAVIQSIAYITTNVPLKSLEYHLAGVCFSSAMHSLIAVDKRGTPLTNCIIWADTRSKDYADTIKNSAQGHEIYMQTGTPIHPMSPLCKLVWMKDQLKAVYDRAFKFISVKEYVLFRFFGKYVVDYSIASATGLFNIHTFRWHEPSLALAGITAGKLSVPVPTTFPMMGVDESYARLMGVEATTPFIVGASDGCLANLGSNAIKAGDACITIGTSGAIRVMADEPRSDPKERIFSYILTQQKFVLGGPVNNGGVIFRWFRDNFAQLEVKEALEKGIDPYAILTAKAAEVRAGAEGLVFLPYLLGERAPHWNANAKGNYFGIQMQHKQAHFVRALLEGIVFGIYSVGKALEETTGDINTIYVNGGFVRSSTWVQILCDVFNKKVVVTESFESSALGAAVVGMKALGFIASIEEVENMVPMVRTYLPNAENHQIYMHNYTIFERLYNKLKDEF